MAGPSQRAQKLRNVLDLNGGWMSRLDIAKATGKTRVMPHDVNLLEQMVADGILEKQQRSVERSGITDVAHDYRFIRPRPPRQSSRPTFHALHWTRIDKPTVIFVVDENQFKEYENIDPKRLSPGLYRHTLTYRGEEPDPNLKIQVVGSEKQLTEESMWQVHRQVIDYLIEKRHIGVGIY